MKEPNYVKLVKDEKTVGGYNDLPPNIREISEKEFAQSMFFSYSPIHIDHRQVTRGAEKFVKGLFQIQIYWFHNGSYVALHNDFWGGKIRFFVGEICQHEVEGVNVGNCLNRYTCTKCGYEYTVDSSD